VALFDPVHPLMPGRVVPEEEEREPAAPKGMVQVAVPVPLPRELSTMIENS
jgi:hypothetical protein